MATTYQGGPLHDGSQADDLTPPLTEAWSHPFGHQVSYPVIADQMAFVTVGDATAATSGTTIEAVSLSTGSVVWSVPLPGSYSWSALAYGDGQLFALDVNGELLALDPLTGATRWDATVPYHGIFTSAPTVGNGYVYVVSSWNGGLLVAVDDRTGVVVWEAPVAGGGGSSPVVTGTGVYVASACQQAADLDPTTGVQIWASTTTCQGGSGTTPVLHDGRLYVRDPLLGGVILDAATGAKVGVFASGPAPAFAGSAGFFLDVGTLTARDVTTQVALWSFTGDGSLDTAPLVANGVVYEGSSTGTLYALSAATGALEWEGSAGSGIAGPDEQGTTQPLTGMAIGEGTMVVPAAETLVAYRSQVAPPATAPASPQEVMPVVGAAQVDVVWAPPAADGGDPVTGYDVYRTGSGGEELVASVGGAATDYVDNTVRPGSTYAYTVTATNAVGTSPPSAPASVLAVGAPDAPTGLTATPGNGQVTLQWRAPASDGGSLIIGYDIYEGTSPGGESATPVERFRFNGTSYTVPGLRNGTTVYFTVRTVTFAGAGPPSTEVSATPTAYVPSVTAVFPRTGTGDGYTLVWVEGTNFAGATKVTACGSVPFKVFSSVLLLVLAPPCPAEPVGFFPRLTVDVQVTTTVGATELVPGDQFTYTWPFANL